MKGASLAFALLVTNASPAIAAGWKVEPSPNAARARISALSSVSCGSGTACMAVGASYNAARVRHALAERWDGSAWRLQPLPRIPGSSENYLASVSCLSARWCTAVGASFGRGGEVTLIEHWNGTRWRVQSSPKALPGLPERALNSVSCTTKSNCVAVGDVGKERYNPYYMATFHGLIDHWNGHEWSVELVVRAPSGTTDRFESVSCASHTACLVVGDSDATGPLAWRWNGRRWRNLHPPNRGETALLLGVSCVRAQSCVAVGEFFVSRDRSALAEHWNGARWTVKQPPKPSSFSGQELTGVSCLSSTQCVAVGGLGSADPTGGLAEAWDGKRWTRQTTPGGNGWPLAQVSCRKAFCVAVGSHGSDTLIERYS